MTPVQILPVIGAGNGLGYYHWSGGVFSFTPIALVAQLEFTYYASGQLPDSGSLGVDNCLLVVAKLATSYAGPGKGINQLAAKYRAEVEKNDFHRMIQPILRSQQSGRVQRGAYSAGSSGGGRSNQIPTA